MKNRNANQTPSANQTLFQTGSARRMREENAKRSEAEQSDRPAGTGRTAPERYDRPSSTGAAPARTSAPRKEDASRAEQTDKPEKKRRWLIPLLLLLLLGAVLYDIIGRKNSGDAAAGHVHDYYLADYQEATETEDGFRTYVCSGCGASYDEVIPLLKSAKASDSDHSGEADPTAPVESAQSNETPLKDMFIFDKLGRENSYIIDYFHYRDSTITDSYGNSYHGYHELISYGGSNSVSAWATLLANGEYSRFTGTIFAEPDMSSDYSIQFLVFADGTQIYDSGFLTRNDPPVSFDIDVTGAKQIMVQAYSSDYTFYDTNPRIYLVDSAFHRQ